MSSIYANDTRKHLLSLAPYEGRSYYSITERNGLKYQVIHSSKTLDGIKKYLQEKQIKELHFSRSYEQNEKPVLNDKEFFKRCETVKEKLSDIVIIHDFKSSK